MVSSTEILWHLMWLIFQNKILSGCIMNIILKRENILLDILQKVSNVCYWLLSVYFPKLHCCCLAAQLCPTLCNFMDCSTSGLPFLHCLLEFPQTYVHWVNDAIQWYHPLSLFAFSLSQHQSLFSRVLALPITWPKYWSFSISTFNEYSWFNSLRIDWLDLLVVQGTLESLLQQHCLKSSILQHSIIFIVHLSNPYMATGKTMDFTLLAKWFLCFLYTL